MGTNNRNKLSPLMNFNKRSLVGNKKTLNSKINLKIYAKTY